MVELDSLLEASAWAVASGLGTGMGGCGAGVVAPSSQFLTRVGPWQGTAKSF